MTEMASISTFGGRSSTVEHRAVDAASPVRPRSVTPSFSARGEHHRPHGQVRLLVELLQSCQQRTRLKPGRLLRRTKPVLGR